MSWFGCCLCGKEAEEPLGAGGRELEELGASVPGAWCHRVWMQVTPDSASLEDDYEVSLSFKTIALLIKWLACNPHTLTGTV